MLLTRKKPVPYTGEQQTCFLSLFSESHQTTNNVKGVFFFFFLKIEVIHNPYFFIVGTAGATYRPRSLFRSCCALHLDSIVLLTGLVIMMVQGSYRIKKL